MSRFETRLVHAGRVHEGTRPVNTPVYRASTILFDTLESYEDRKSAPPGSLRYGRHGTPSSQSLEQAITALEGGYRCRIVPSGLAAIAIALSSLTRRGGHLLMPDSVYEPARHFCDRQLVPRGISVEYYDPLIGPGIAAMLRPDTVGVYCESPGSLTFDIQDIPAISAACHERGIPVVADNTWATSCFFSPFDKGVDISLHAATKYICGHSDVMMGAIVTSEPCWQAVNETTSDFGYSASSDDCYLALRGLRTLAVRLQCQMASAISVASWLEGRPEVARVLHPALPSHPGHAIWKRDFTGAASLFSFELKPVDKAAVSRFINALELFGIGSSWGGYESLINVAHLEKSRTVTRPVFEGPLIRMHVGLENPADLIADLEQGFLALQAGRP